MKNKIFKYTTFRDGTYANGLLVVENCPYRQGGDAGVFGLGSWKCEKKCPHCVKRDTDKLTVECNFRVLDLSLTYHWYDEIESGRKAVEYREMSDYWCKRLRGCDGNCRNYLYPSCNTCKQYDPSIKFDAVRFHRGQGGKQTMMFECARIIVAHGHVRFGAFANTPMFNIYLGKRLQ